MGDRGGWKTNRYTMHREMGIYLVGIRKGIRYKGKQIIKGKQRGTEKEKKEEEAEGRGKRLPLQRKDRQREKGERRYQISLP